MRAPPKFDPAAVIPKSTPATIDEIRRYRFITDVMGGGVIVSKHIKRSDEVTPIRAASIRGQLRFWWRACNPRRCTTLAELQAMEAEVWGSASRPSAITVVVLQQPGPPRSVKVFEYVASKQDPSKSSLKPARDMIVTAYGAFPLQPDQDAQRTKAEPGSLFNYGNDEFQLRFTCSPETQADLEAAIWAWETFGGLGARTRRGFGSIQRAGVPIDVASVKARLEGCAAVPRIDGIPSLSGARLAVSRNRLRTTSREAWSAALQALRDLRQGPGLGRNPGTSGRPGRSRWPEADQIRRLTNTWSSNHKPVMLVESFPRAAFGMPIVFQFKDKHAGDPGGAERGRQVTLTLKPANADRLASSLILRPLPVAGGFLPMALVLQAPLPPAVVVAGVTSTEVRTNVDEREARAITPLQVDGQTFTDPVERLLHEIRQC